MRSMDVDVAVIGAGTAGLAAQRAAAKAGRRAVVIEQGAWGTTCVRVGCMPSKLLLTAGRAAREARCAKTFGVEVGPVRVDGLAVMVRVRAERDDFLRALLEGLDDIAEEDRIQGHARFIGPDRLQVGDDLEIKAGAVVIATGSRPSVPSSLEPLGDAVLTNDTVFDLPEPPGSLAVVGAGPLGLELAAAFARLGVKVAVFDEDSQVGGLKDEAVSEAARTLMAQEFDLHLGVELQAEATPAGARLRWTGGEEAGEGVFERVLAAAGRPSNLEGLGLGTTGLTLDDHGVPEHDPLTGRCGESAIFIAGDAGHDLPVLHVASRQGERAGRNAASLPRVEVATAQAALAIAFTDPDIASVGKPLKAIEGARVGACDFDAGRGQVEARREGLIRIYAGADGVIAGGEMVGPKVEHLAHALAFMVQQGLTAEAALELPFYHPTFEEHLQACLRDLAAQARG